MPEYCRGKQGSWRGNTWHRVLISSQRRISSECGMALAPSVVEVVIRQEDPEGLCERCIHAHKARQERREEAQDG